MDRSKKYLYNVGAIFLIFLTVFVISLTINEFDERGYQGLDQPRSIEVSGEETIVEVPDQAKIVFSVLTQGEDYKEATNQNSERMEQVRDYLKEEGIEENNLQTKGFDVSPRYETIEEDDRTRREIVGYEVENKLEVKVEDLDLIDRLTAGAIDSGANKVSNLQFIVSNEDELIREAREEAIRDARKEAKKIADSLEVRLGRVLDFTESGRPIGYREVALEQAEAMDAGDVPIEPGETEINAEVRVTFEIH